MLCLFFKTTHQLIVMYRYDTMFGFLFKMFLCAMFSAAWELLLRRSGRGVAWHMICSYSGKYEERKDYHYDDS